MNILGIDPGAGGGWAVVDSGVIRASGRMTTMPYGKKKKVVNGPQMLQAILSHNLQIDFAICELVFNQPHDGASSSFTFGMNTAACLMAAQLACPEINMVSPAVWKKFFDLPGGKQGKIKSLELAEQAFRFRGEAVNFKVKANDGIAEAALMARWLGIQMAAPQTVSSGKVSMNGRPK